MLWLNCMSLCVSAWGSLSSSGGVGWNTPVCACHGVGTLPPPQSFPPSLLSLPLVLSLFLSSFRPAFPFSPYFLPSFPCCYCCCCCVASVMSDSVRPQRRQPTRLLCPWDSPGKNTGVGCHFLLQCMKVKSEREVAQSCSTLSNPMDCSL